MYIYIHIHTYIESVCMYVCMHACMYVCIEYAVCKCMRCQVTWPSVCGFKPNFQGKGDSVSCESCVSALLLRVQGSRQKGDFNLRCRSLTLPSTA